MFKIIIPLLFITILFADVFDDAGEYIPPVSSSESSNNEYNNNFHTIIIDSNDNTIYNNTHRRTNKLFYGLSNGEIYTIKRARQNMYGQWEWTSHRIRFNGSYNNGYSYNDLYSSHNTLYNQLEQTHRDKIFYKKLLTSCNSEKIQLNQKLLAYKAISEEKSLSNIEEDYYSKLISKEIYTVDHRGIKIEFILPKNIKTPFKVKINGYEYTIK
jgi:hypothetical protein